jgi:hypothetical protein
MDECVCAREVSSAMVAWWKKWCIRDYGFGVHPSKVWEDVCISVIMDSLCVCT